MTAFRTRTERLAWSTKTGRAITHGIRSGYSNHGCGCDPCWEAFQSSRSYVRENELQRRASDRAQVQP